MPVPSDLIQAADSSARDARPGRFELPADTIYAVPNDPFFFVFYPKHQGNWKVETILPGPGIPDEDVGTWWLPVLQHEPVRAGVNGNHTPNSGEPERQYDTAHLRIVRKGGIILPHELGYMKERPVIHPKTKAAGTRYHDAWSELRPGLPDQRVKFDFDRTRNNRWLLWLMREGWVPGPELTLVEMHKARVAKRVTRRAIGLHPDPTLKAERVEDARSQVTAATTAVVPVAVADSAPSRKKPAYKRVN